MIVNRIVDFKTIPGSEIAENEQNYKLHPRAQRGAFRGLADQVGIVGALVAYYSERNGGALTLLDGHMRRSEYPGVDWPVLVLDISDEEADLILATFDTIGDEAEVQPGDRLETLVSRATRVAQSPAVVALLEKAKERARVAKLMAQARQQLAGRKDEARQQSENIRRGLTSGRGRVRAVIWTDKVATFEQALKATGNPNRGDALIEVCESYLERKRQEGGDAGRTQG